jgi:hypothetical protein
LVCREDCGYRCYRDLGADCVPDASLEADGAASGDGMTNTGDGAPPPDGVRDGPSYPDAVPGMCPNGTCDPGECNTCPMDCIPNPYMCCMNGICEPPTDCAVGCTSACTVGDCLPTFCGDTYCDPGETCLNCFMDCGSCMCNSDPACNMPPENCMNCPQQCTVCAI